MKTLLLFVLLISVSLTYSCKKEETKTGCTDSEAYNFNPEAKIDDGSCIYRGCTDSEALNYDPKANEDNGTCEYSTVTFYATTDYYNHYETTEYINVYVEGEHIGKVNKFYKNGVDSCNAPGTILYTFKNPGQVKWKTIAITRESPGNAMSSVYDSGFVSSSNLSCIKVDVTPKM